MNRTGIGRARRARGFVPSHARTMVFASLLWTIGVAAEEADPVQPIVTLRESGYLLGDLIEERVQLAVPSGASLDPDSLPLPGRVAPWMEVRAARMEPPAQANEARIVVRYQIFAEVEQTQRVPIPAFKLRVNDGARTRVVEVPAQSFLLSPALPPTLADEDRELKPAAPPRLMPITKPMLGALLSALAAAACAAYLLWAYDRLPFLPRSPGPFASLWRRWRRRGRVDLSVDESATLLRDWHAALNRAAGETLYPSTMARLFDAAPHLASLREPIETLYGRSWQSFFGTPPTAAPRSDELLDLLRRSAERERGVPC